MYWGLNFDNVALSEELHDKVTGLSLILLNIRFM